MPDHRRVLRLAAALATCGACATSPTGRKQLQLVPDDQMNRLGEEAFAQLEQQTPRSRDPAQVALVRCVSRRILEAVPGESTDWDVEVFVSEQINAFALPGRNIGVYTGILRVAENPSQLAAIIGHEVAHVVAKHSEERVSELLLAQAGLTLADALLPGTQAHQLAMAALGLGAQYGVILPHSRTHELEADRLGLEYMARAGFDPRQAVDLWENMARIGEGKEAPEFLSTHPATDKRIAALEEHVPVALAIQRQVRPSRPDCLRAAGLASASK